MKRLVIATILFASSLLATETEDIAFKSTLDGTEQRYVEMLPDSFEPMDAHDVLIAFHGHGSDRWHFIRDMRG